MSSERGSAAFSWATAAALPAFAAYQALSQPIEEHAYDAALLHIYRSVVFSDARAAGWLYPRWVESINAGLGGPLFNYYPPLTYYLLDWLHTLGLPQPVAWRALIALALLAASVGTFALGLALFNKASGALVSAVLFVYSYPLIGDLFGRGSPQGVAMGLWPWALWGIVRLIQSPSGCRFVFVVVTWAAVMLIHNLSALFLLPVAGAVTLFMLRQHGLRRVAASMVAVAFSVLLCAFFIVPFLTERRFVRFENVSQLVAMQPAMNPISLHDLFRPSPAFDLGLGNNAVTGFLGPIPGFFLLAGLLVALALWNRRRHEASLMVALILTSLLILWLQTASANAVWTSVRALEYVQFRWRLLGLVALSMSLVAGVLVAMLAKPWDERLSYPCIAVGILVALPVLYPQLQFRYNHFEHDIRASEVPSLALEENLPGLTTTNEFLPVWRYLPFTADEVEKVALSPVANVPQGGQITRSERQVGQVVFDIYTPVDFTAALHTLYFPGWVAVVDGTQQMTRPAEDGSGYLLVDVPAGTHRVSVRYEGTAVQNLGALVSGLAALSLPIIAIFWHSREEHPLTSPVLLQHRWWVLVTLLLLLGLKAYWLDPHTTWLRRSSTCQAIDSAQTMTSVWFDGRIHLCGYTLQRTVFNPGDIVRMTLWWEVDQPTSEAANSFVHLLGTSFNPATGNPLWGQQDKQVPAEHPITAWVPGALYRDVYEFRIDPGTPAGEYELEIGWWQPLDGQRLMPSISSPESTLSVSHLDSLLLSGLKVEDRTH